MNIFRQEWRMGRRSLVVWTASLILVTMFFMLLYPTIAQNLADFMRVVEQFPPSVQEALGIQNIAFGADGYYSFILVYVLLAGAVQAMTLGVSVLSAEVRDKTADFLYAKPVSRPSLITAKLLSVLTQLLVTNAVFFVAAWLTVRSVNAGVDAGTGIDLRRFALLTGSLLLLQLFFAALGLFVSTFLARIRTVLPVSMGVVFFFYVLYLLNQTLKNDALAYLSPFGYFEAEGIIRNGGYSGRFLLTAALLSMVFVAWSYRSYMRKDLPAI